MRRQQINLTTDPIGLNSLKTGLTRYLINHDVAFVEVSLEDDRLAVAATLKKSLATQNSISDLIREMNKYVRAQYDEILTHVTDGVVAENNKLQIICTFEVDT